MSNNSTTMLAVLLIAGLVIGAGVGYFMAPGKVTTETRTITVEVHPFEGKTLEIGYVAPSGLASRSLFIQNLVQEDINEFLDVLGYDLTFEWKMEDAEGDEMIHLDKVKGFNALGIEVFQGGAWSDMALASLGYVNENDMLMISESSTWPELAIEGDNLFRLCGSDLGKVQALVDMIVSWGFTHIVVADDPTVGWTDPYYNAFKEGIESRGGEIVTRRMSTQANDDAVSEAVSQYGTERVCVAVIVPIYSQVILDTEGYTNLRNVIWMGLATPWGCVGKDLEIISLANGLQTELRLFSPDEATAYSGNWEIFESEYTSVVGETPGYYDGVAYDAAWCIAMAMLEAQSNDALIVKDIFPQVCYSHYGVTGRCNLDSAGDRIQDFYDIWGYAEVDGVHTYLKYGYIRNGEVGWGVDELTSQGISIPW